MTQEKAFVIRTQERGYYAPGIGSLQYSIIRVKDGKIFHLDAYPWRVDDLCNELNERASNQLNKDTK